MQKSRILFIIAVLVLILFGFVLPRTYAKPKSTFRNPIKCDDSLWKYVHSPSRLKIIKNCISVTGIIISEKSKPDGDYHIRLKLDSQYKHLLNTKNMSRQGGTLVLEPICENKVTQKDSKKACAKYKGDIEDAAKGAHVKVTGSYVLDKYHGWNEIHPVSSITRIH